MNKLRAFFSILLVSLLITSCTKSIRVSDAISVKKELEKGEHIESNVNEPLLPHIETMKEKSHVIDNKEESKIYSQTEIISTVDKYLGRDKGININLFPDEDVVINGQIYHYVEVVFGDIPAVSLFVDMRNELLFSNKEEIDSSNPLNFRTLDNLKSSGVEIIEDQSFDVDFIRDTRFISAIEKSNGVSKARFYLANKHGVITYEFPPHYAEGGWLLDKILAVSFRDADADGDKDIIVICDVITGAGKTGVIPFSVADIYFQQEDGTYITNNEMAQELLMELETKTIQSVLEYIKRTY